MGIKRDDVVDMVSGMVLQLVKSDYSQQLAHNIDWLDYAHRMDLALIEYTDKSKKAQFR